MARVFNEDDSSDEEIAVNLQLEQRLRINRENGILEDTSLEDSKEMKQISNMHRKIFAQNSQSSSSSSVELQSDNASGINGSDHYLNKKRQNGDKNIEQSANPKRTCLSDRIHKAPEWRDSKKKGSSNRPHSKTVKVTDPLQVPSVSSAGFHFDDSDDSDFDYPLPIAAKKPLKMNEHTLENPPSSHSATAESAQLPNFESKPSTSKFNQRVYDSYRNDESKGNMKNGTLKGRHESSGQLTTSKRSFGRFKKNKVLDSDDSEEETPTPIYRTRPIIFSSSDSDSDFKHPTSQIKYGVMPPIRTRHELDFEDGYASPRPNRAFRSNHKSNKKAHNAMPSSRADSSDGCDRPFLPSDFQCKPTTSRSGRARRSPRMNISTSLTSTNGFSNGNSSSAPVRGRRSNGADRGSRHSGSPHYRNTASRDTKSRARTSSSRTKQDKNSIAARYPDLFDAEESENEFFTANSYSDTETSTESLGVTINASFPSHGTISCSIDCDRDGTSDDEVRVVFSTGPSIRTNDSRRGASRTLGRRLHRGTPPHRQHQSVHEVVSLSPDPVEQVRQMEEDERMARMLQAQFDAEVDPDYAPTTSQPFPAEPQESTDVEDEIVDPDGEDTDSPDTDVDPSSIHYAVPFSGIFGAPRFMLHRVNRPQSFTHNSSPIPAAYFGNNRRYSRNRRRLTFGPPRESPEFQIARLFGIGIPGMGEIFAAGGDDYEALLSLDLTGDVVPRGLHKSDINRLPTRKFVHPNSMASACSSETRHKRTDLNKECQVCLTDYETGDVLRILPCFHEFHTPCIDPWLKINQTCPVCRVTVDLDS